MPKTPPPSDLDLLRQHAEELWVHQQEVFAAAAKAAQDVGRESAAFTRDEVAPRVQRAVDFGSNAVRTAAGRTLPVVSDALATVAAFSDPRVRSALAGLGRLRGAVPVAAPVAPPKKGIGVGGWIGIGIGVLAAGAIAYAVWQTLRADDELWIEDDVPEESSASV